MKPAVLLAVLLSLVCGAFADLKVGQPAPEISLDRLLPDRPAANASLSALRGRAVVLEFWATWCGPCATAIAHLNELAVRFKDKPVVFLSVSDENLSAVDPYLKKRPIEGWVGLTKERKMFADYGVSGVPRTFLIDANGNLAASLFPEDLTDEMLNDLLARRPITGPKVDTVSLATRPSEDSLARPVLDVMIRPTTTMEAKLGIGSAKDNVSIRGMPVRAMLPSLYSVSPVRMLGDAIEDNTRYDVWVSLPGANREAFQQTVRDVIRIGFDLNIRKETREAEVFILTAPSGRPPGLVEAKETTSYGVISGPRGLSLRPGSLTSLAGAIEPLLGKPVIDETRVEGSFNIELKYDRSVPGSLEEAIRVLGFKLEAARRPIEFLMVERAQ